MHEVVNGEPVSNRGSLKSKLIAGAKTTASAFQGKSFETTTGEGRSRERYRRVMLTAVSSGAARVTSIGTMLVSVPLIVNYFGAERYALWATITSTVTLLVFADLGIGSGLLNIISESNGTGNREAAISYVSTGFFALLAVALVAASIFGAVYPFVPWKRIFNLGSAVAIREAGPAAAIFIICFLIQLPLGVVQRVQLGYQEGFVTQICSVAANLLGLLGLICVVHFRAGLPLLVLAVAGAPVVAGILNTAILFRLQRPWLTPRLDRISAAATRRILHLGFLFLVIQVACAVGYQTDNLIIAQVLGASQVTEYAVPFKLFAIAPAIMSMLIAPLWPAYAEASVRGDVHWVKETLRRSILIGVAVNIPINLLLVIFGRLIIRMWVGPQIAPSLLLLVGLASWAILTSLSGPLAMFLNGIGFLRVQAVCAVLMAVSNVILSIVLTRKIGVSGVIYGSIMSQVLFSVVPYCFYFPRLLAEINSRARTAMTSGLPPVVAGNTVACS
jgi:O-antigen/teichoic acid export membrane protein